MPGKGMRKDRSASHITATKRRIEAMRMRQEGKTYKEIGEELGCSAQRAFTIVNEQITLLRQSQSELAENLLRITNDRLERLINLNWQKALSGDRGAMEMILKLIDRQARMLGLDAAKKLEAKVVSSTEDVENLKARARMMGLELDEEDSSDMPQDVGERAAEQDAGE